MDMNDRETTRRLFREQLERERLAGRVRIVTPDKDEQEVSTDDEKENDE